MREEAAALDEASCWIRKSVLETCLRAGAGHLTSSLSCADHRLPITLSRLGVPAEKAYGYVYGGRDLIRRGCGLDGETVAREVLRRFGSQAPS